MSLREQRYQQKLQQRQGRLQAGGGAFDAQYGLNGAPPSFKHSTFHQPPGRPHAGDHMGPGMVPADGRTHDFGGYYGQAHAGRDAKSNLGPGMIPDAGAARGEAFTNYYGGQHAGRDVKDNLGPGMIPDAGAARGDAFGGYYGGQHAGRDAKDNLGHGMVPDAGADRGLAFDGWYGNGRDAKYTGVPSSNILAGPGGNGAPASHPSVGPPGLPERHQARVAEDFSHKFRAQPAQQAGCGGASEYARGPPMVPRRPTTLGAAHSEIERLTNLVERLQNDLIAVREGRLR